MSFLSVFGIGDVLAAPVQQTPGAGSLFSAAMPMMLAAAVLFYFMILRPQNKQAKEQSQLLSEISKGDEVLTAGGIVGKINKIHDDFVTLLINESSELTMKKSSIAKILPKGSVKSIN